MFVNGKIILVACVASVSAQVRRESWNEGAKNRDDNFRAIECFHSRGQHLCKFIRTKESVCIRKELNSHRTGLGHQHGRRFIILGHQYGRRDVMWKHTSEKLAIRRISFWLNLNVYFYSLKTQTWSTTLVSCVTATTIREPLSTLLMFSSKGCGLSSTNIGNPRWNENRSKIQSPGTITPENCTPRAYLRSSLHEGKKFLAPRRS